MTFIAAGVSSSSAYIATDTWAYTSFARRLGHSTKVAPLLHLDMAIATQGNVAFGTFWLRAGAQLAAVEGATFDTFVADAPEQLRDLWKELGDEVGDVGSALVLHIGRSERLGRYAIIGHSSFDDFEASDLGAFFVTPAPYSRSMSAYERDELLAGADGPVLADVGLLDDWVDPDDDRPAPRSTAGWIDLAEQAREDRAMSKAPGLKILVGGHLHITSLDRNGVTQRKVHTFDDSPEVMAQIMRGTLHPLSQLSACDCGSGRQFKDCCMVQDGPCLCGSGKNIRNCCMVIDTATTVRA